MKLNILVPLARAIRKFIGRPDCAKYTFFGTCADVPTSMKQALSEQGHSVTDVDGHYDIDGMSYNVDEGVVVAADPRPVILAVNGPTLY